MKTITLVLSNIYNMYKYNKLFFTVFVISFLITVLSLCFMYSYSKNVMEKNIESNLEKRRITIDFSNEITDYSLIERIYNSFADRIFQVKYIAKSIDENNETDNRFIVAYIPDFKYRLIEYGRSFTLGNENCDLNSVIISSTYISPTAAQTIIGSKISISGNDFTVIGVNGNYDSNVYAEVLYEKLKKNRYPIIQISYVIKNYKELKSTREFIIEIFKKYLKNNYIIQPSNDFKQEESAFIQRIAESIIIVALSIINMMILYRFLIYSRKRDYAIMQLVGASESRIITIIYIELSIILFITYIVSIFLNSIILLPVYKNLGINLSYNFVDYIFIYIILFCIANIALFPVFASSYSAKIKQDRFIISIGR